MDNQTALEKSSHDSLLVHPFVSEPGAQNQSTFPPSARLPQFSHISSMILSRIKDSSCITSGTLKSEEDEQDTHKDDLTLPLDEDATDRYAAPDEYIFENDDSFQTANVDFTQESIPFRPPYEPIVEDESMVYAPPEISREEAIEAQRQKWMTSLPEGVSPAKLELVGFTAGPEVSDSSLTSYFYGKSKTDLLNILSFCDQLEPQLLVDLFVSVSKRHPELPIFDSPDWEAKVREQQAVKAAALAAAQARAKSHQRPRHGHTLLNPRMRHKRKGVRKIVKVVVSTAVEPTGKTVVLQEEESEEEEDVLPPTWPKAGEGLYAKLVPDNHDRLYLADEGDEAFSHFMVDGLGNLTALAACG